MYNSRLSQKPSFKPSASRDSLGAGAGKKWKVAPSPKRPAWNSKQFLICVFIQFFSFIR